MNFDFFFYLSITSIYSFFSFSLLLRLHYFWTLLLNIYHQLWNFKNDLRLFVRLCSNFLNLLVKTSFNLFNLSHKLLRNWCLISYFDLSPYINQTFLTCNINSFWSNTLKSLILTIIVEGKLKLRVILNWGAVMIVKVLLLYRSLN